MFRCLFSNNNRHYEKIGSEIKDITEEIPFEIPNSWCWCRLGSVCQLINGDRGKNYPSKDKLMDKGDIPFISAINISENTISLEKLLYLRQEQYEKLGSGKLQKNDVVVCIRGSLGKVCLYPFDKGAIASSLVILRTYTAISERFLISYINSALFASEMKRYDNGTAQPNLAANDLYKFLIPLPSFEEQKRIVKKLENIMKVIKTL